MENVRFKSLTASGLDLSRAQIDKFAKSLAIRRSELDRSQAFADHEPSACAHCGCVGKSRFGVQNVNNDHERLKTWINFKLRGVATKYLPSDLAWQRLKTWKAEPMSPVELIGSALGHPWINL